MIHSLVQLQGLPRCWVCSVPGSSQGTSSSSSPGTIVRHLCKDTKLLDNRNKHCGCERVTFNQLLKPIYCGISYGIPWFAQRTTLIFIEVKLCKASRWAIFLGGNLPVSSSRFCSQPFPSLQRSLFYPWFFYRWITENGSLASLPENNSSLLKQKSLLNNCIEAE